jgi:NADPH:quinone reductase-like Zn-dependent oxidoreductase
VLVAVKAAGVGPWDRLMREGRISQTLPVTLGSEVSGTVVALGAFAAGSIVHDEYDLVGYSYFRLIDGIRVVSGGVDLAAPHSRAYLRLALAAMVGGTIITRATTATNSIRDTTISGRC